MDSLYVVMLHGMPEAFSERRAQLEAAFRNEIDRQFGGDANAAAALHTYIDCNLEVRGLSWPDAVGNAMRSLSTLLPPGARFECDLNWQVVNSHHYPRSVCERLWDVYFMRHRGIKLAREYSRASGECFGLKRRQRVALAWRVHRKSSWGNLDVVRLRRLLPSGQMLRQGIEINKIDEASTSTSRPAGVSSCEGLEPINGSMRASRITPAGIAAFPLKRRLLATAQRADISGQANPGGNGWSRQEGCERRAAKGVAHAAPCRQQTCRCDLRGWRALDERERQD